jgi:hypothetical protein
VYCAINGEREYQARAWGPGGFKRDGLTSQADGLALTEGTSLPEFRREVASYLTFMQHHLDEAKKAVTTQDGSAAALDQLRKVLALGVACAEQHGLPFRKF